MGSRLLRGVGEEMPRNLKRLLLVVQALVGCAPDVPQNAPLQPTIVVEFDPSSLPPVAPTPNDLTPRDPVSGKLQIPSSVNDTPAQTEFNTDYLGNLTAFPFESIAEAAVSGPLDPATVDPSSVVVVDITLFRAAVLASTSTGSSIVQGLEPQFDPSRNVIVVPPPTAGWTRAHQYAVLVLTPSPEHAAGVRGASGEAVIGSPAWALVSSTRSLVACPNGNLAAPSCALAVDVIPSAESDPVKRLHDQLTKALLLEQIRLAFQPVLTAAEGLLGLSDASSIPIAWTFTVLDGGEMTFEPENGVIPFPNDVLRSNGRVTLPNPHTGQPLMPADCAAPMDSMTSLYCGLNTLDGFSTVAPPVSENSFTAGAAEQANLSASSLTATTAGLLPVASLAPVATTPLFAPCLNCESSTTASGAPQTLPQQLQWQLIAPLDEKTTYAAYVTVDVKDDAGKNVAATPTFALLRLANPLLVGGKSQVNVLTDAQAGALEPLRLALKPAVDALENNGVARRSLALAWAFTTESESAALDALHTYVGSAAYRDTLPTLPNGVVGLTDATAQYPATPGIGKIYAGVYVTPFALTGAGGTFNLANPVAEPVLFTLAVPPLVGTMGMPGTGYPVTIFGHGITRDRNDLVALAGALGATGHQAVVAADAPWHGDRSSCSGSGAYAYATYYAAAHPNDPMLTEPDDAACADPVSMKCNEDPLIGRCVARVDSPTTRPACPILPGDSTGILGCRALGLGSCGADGKCDGGDFARDGGGRPLVSGWNMFSLTNFFATRDNLRQDVIDLSQLVQALRFGASMTTSLPIRITGAGGEGVATVDPSKLNYVGQSLGGILGSLFNSVSPETTNVVLNVAGGDLPNLLLGAPAFAAAKATLLAGLAEQTPAIEPGTPAFDQFLTIAQWVLDPADPVNVSWRLTHPVNAPGTTMSSNPNRRAYVQFIEGDQTVPNASSLALVAAAARPNPTTLASTFVPPNFGCTPPLYCYEFTEAGDGFDATTAPLADRDAFLLSPPSPQSAAITTKAQTLAAMFVSAGTPQ
jgi:hypothetical protein